MATPDPKAKIVTIYGRLSFPTWTAQAAYDRSQTGKYPAKDVASASPDFQLLVEQAQLDKFHLHVTTKFFPYCIAQEQAGEKRDVLSQQEVKDLTAQLENVPTFDGVYNIPVKPVHEKSQALAPETVGTVKCIGNKGSDIELKAIVNGEDEFLNQAMAADILSWPIIRPIDQTVHQMYPGCYVAATLNLYAYHNGKLPGFSAGASVAVFKADGERFGGGQAIDEDEIFAD